MHPCLSEWPSNMFYEGTLQNGVTEGERVMDQVSRPVGVLRTACCLVLSGRRRVQGVAFGGLVGWCDDAAERTMDQVGRLVGVLCVPRVALSWKKTGAVRGVLGV